MYPAQTAIVGICALKFDAFEHFRWIIYLPT